MIKHKCLGDVMFLVKTIAITSKDIQNITEEDIENIAHLLIRNITFEKWKDNDLNLLICGIIKGYIYANKIINKGGTICVETQCLENNG